MGNRIEPAATSRSRCVTCGEPIDKGAARLAEEHLDQGLRKVICRYYHVRCAAAVHPELVQRALSDVRPGAVFDRAAIEAKIAARVAHAEEQRRLRYEALQAERAASAPVVAADATTLELIEQLEADPADPGTLAVLADQLAARGDGRGELIAVQLALAKADRVALRRVAARDRRGGAAARGALARGGGGDIDDDDGGDGGPGAALDLDGLTRRRAELLAHLAAPLDGGDRAEWGIGFVRRLELRRRPADRREELLALWRHPSVRLVQELRLAFESARDAAWLARLAEVVPRSVRRIELIVEGDGAAAELPALLAALPRLEALALDARADLARLSHPRLARLSIGRARRLGEPALAAARLSPDALPALESLSLAAGAEHVLDGGGEPGAPSMPGAGSAPAAAAMATALAAALGRPAPAYRLRRDDLDEVCALLAPRWLARLAHLAFTGGALTAAGALALERGLDGRRLRRLELLETEVPLALQARLARLCDELVFPVPAPSAEHAVWVEHAGKPEWGRGEIVRRFDGKLEVKFPGHGVKVFKADAPFLRLGA